MPAKKLSRSAKVRPESTEGMHRVNLLNLSEYNKVTVRHIGGKTTLFSQPISPEEIRALRERANLSQAAMARMMNLTAGYLSQLERGVKQPKGSSLALLNIVRRKGIEVLL
jgi:putative transcriptional regulator